ncbi:hypothetical protein DL96DRAFT_891157 [Flagelloscypha sp. PMI_526]|nr:hypothetical protein DL96DRAFT_891157 [Flagelloscypha sp. PMI_526]
MKPEVLLLLLSPLAAHATLNGHCTPPATPDGINYTSFGICIHTSTCDSYGGTYVSGHCPYDANDIKCCFVDPCKGIPNGFCEWTNEDCIGGTWVPGHCPGGDNFRCCRY